MSLSNTDVQEARVVCTPTFASENLYVGFELDSSVVVVLLD